MSSASSTPTTGRSPRSSRSTHPPETPVIIENVVEQIDAIVRPIRGTGWQTTQPGDREVRRQFRLVLNNSGCRRRRRLRPRLIPIWLAQHPGKTKIAAGL